MINSTDLKDIIINSISNKTDAKQIHDLIGNILNSYLIKNLQIEGNYIGLLPNGAPDPLNGIVKFKLQTCAISGEDLLKFAKISINEWYKAFTINIKLTSVLSQTGDKVTLNAPSFAFGFINNSSIDIKDSKSLQDSWSKIMDILINDIKTAVPISTPLSARGVGTGTVILSKFN